PQGPAWSMTMPRQDRAADFFNTIGREPTSIPLQLPDLAAPAEERTFPTSAQDGLRSFSLGSRSLAAAIGSRCTYPHSAPPLPLPSRGGTTPGGRGEGDGRRSAGRPLAIVVPPP